MPETLAIELADVANSLVSDEFPSRSVTLIQLDPTPSDTDKPWRSNPTPRATPTLSETFDAIFVPLSSGLGLRTVSEDIASKTEQVCIIAPGSERSISLRDFNELHEADGEVWKIMFTETLKPGSIDILYYIGVSR